MFFPVMATVSACLKSNFPFRLWAKSRAFLTRTQWSRNPSYYRNKWKWDSNYRNLHLKRNNTQISKIVFKHISYIHQLSGSSGRSLWLTLLCRPIQYKRFGVTFLNKIHLTKHIPSVNLTEVHSLLVCK